MTLITVTFNGETRQVPAGSSLADVLASNGQPAASFASAVNGEFVARDARASTPLADGDAVFTFQAITGG
ncbi:MAG: sulfur carrier protein ThiS [Polaromonas sp.]|uniref:sulfur carrier protein ThiS n=1 Tax=Polaromonas sp. TaxID=1869339 RepID=UPI002731E80C|nr:sulfur carrier protein ThiS [Polaromonas sp.]MDP1741448.1 sulfur carrier protein ThiS [Polaromonas sp.]MDP1956307.1 sulfur carrier protein ThiS [Polaromonas sp.]MDP3354723.1 sulfur carrier protein ThiS [Polaromonas sp.]MDP3752179.1 sulfur carrier protein ThiS [Polaromonas sp.]